jgi:hypothetical protein
LRQGSAEVELCFVRHDSELCIPVEGKPLGQLPKVLAAGLVDVRATQHAPALDVCWGRTRARRAMPAAGAHHGRPRTPHRICHGVPPYICRMEPVPDPPHVPRTGRRHSSNARDASSCWLDDVIYQVACALLRHRGKWGFRGIGEFLGSGRKDPRNSSKPAAAHRSVSSFVPFARSLA